MTYKKLLVSKENGVATITLNRPEVLNALDGEIEAELGMAIKETGDDEAVKVLVITGAGRGFCAGRDQRGAMASQQRQPAHPKPSAAVPWDNDIALWQLPKPVIAAVNGVAVGGGLSIALSCDLIVASEAATFGEFFIRRAMIASGCTTWLLPRLVGPHMAKKLLFLGDLIDAKEAERIGLVQFVYPADQFSAKVKELAERLAKAPAMALGMMKILVNDGLNRDMVTSGRAEKHVDDYVLIPSHSDDIREGRASFVEGRTAKFK